MQAEAPIWERKLIHELTEALKSLNQLGFTWMAKFVKLLSNLNLKFAVKSDWDLQSNFAVKPDQGLGWVAVAYLAYLVRGGGKQLGRARGVCTVSDQGLNKKAENPCASARASYGWGPGACLRAPAGGPGGRSPRKLSSFQQIRAFKMVVRGSGVGGAGVTRFSVVVDSMAFFFSIRTSKHM